VQTSEKKIGDCSVVRNCT